MRNTFHKISIFNKERNTTSSLRSSISLFGHNKAILYSTSILLLILIALFICPPAHDNDSHALTGTSVASDTTLSISLSNSILPLDITPTSSSGTFATTADDDTGTSTAVIHVATNNITGYTLGIKASNPASSSADKLISNNEKCENTPTSAKCAINSIPSPTSEADYIDSDNTALNNTWGYLPSKYNSENNTNYLPAPVAGDTIAVTSGPNPENTTTPDAKSGNNNALVEDEYTIDYGMRIDYSPYAGTYSTNYNNQSYVITAVGNLVPYSVSYDANKPEQASATANVDNMPTAQAGNVQGGDTIAVLLSQKVPTLGNSNPSTGDYDYAGYVFAGWCTVQPEVPNEINGQPNTQGYQSCPIDTQQPDQARLFQPGDNFGIDQTVDNTQILYATWGAPAKVTFDSNGLVFDEVANNTRNNTPKRTSLFATKRDVSANNTNTAEIIPTYEDGKITGKRINIFYSGSYKEPVHEPTDPPTNYIFKGWSTTKGTTDPAYIGEDSILGDFQIEANEDATLYAIWAYTTVITFDGNGADGGTMEQFIIEADKTEALPQNIFTKEGYYFAGWNTKADESGDSYKNQGNYTTLAGSNNVTLYAEWTDCAPNHICYNDNGANSPITMSDQTKNYDNGYEADAITSGMEVNLWPMNYKYDTNNDGYNDYGFAGWSEDKNAASKILDTDPDNDPTIYGPNQTITLGDVSAYGLKLYAVWMPVVKDSNNAELTFQTANLLTTTLADGTTLESKPIRYVTALRDYRDNQVYAVAKLADENYWMIENLRLENSATVGNNINDQSITNESLAEGYGGNFVGLADAEYENFGDVTTANSIYNSSNITGSYYGETNGYRYPRYNNINTKSPVVNMTTFDSDTNIYSLGNSYTWGAAIANTYNFYGTSNHSNMATSICPTGWHLPYGGYGTSGPNLGNTRGGFYYLDVQMGGTGEYQGDNKASNRWRSFPVNLIYSGHYTTSSSYHRGDYGAYWSNSAYAVYSVYTLTIGNSYIMPQYSGTSKYQGIAMRCVIK